jgi:hypothetical protein
LTNELKQSKEKHLIETASGNKLDLVDKRMYAVGTAILEYETPDYVKDFIIFKSFSLSQRFTIQKTTRDILNQKKIA